MVKSIQRIFRYLCQPKKAIKAITSIGIGITAADFFLMRDNHIESSEETNQTYDKVQLICDLIFK